MRWTTTWWFSVTEEIKADIEPVMLEMSSFSWNFCSYCCTQWWKFHQNDDISISKTISGGCFTNVSQALQNNLAKIYNARNDIYGANFKLKLCTCAQSHVLGTHTKFQLEILIRSTISAIHKFRESILESSRNISETTPWCSQWWKFNKNGVISISLVWLINVPL